jgi:hypothetical protein
MRGAFLPDALVPAWAPGQPTLLTFTGTCSQLLLAGTCRFLFSGVRQACVQV